MEPEIRIPIGSEVDVVTARMKGRALAGEQGFASSDQTVIATVISELARNIVTYARRGEIVLQSCSDSRGRPGLTVTAVDKGPGIADIERAMQDGFSTSNSLGLGLPGSRRLMDEFHIHSVLGEGTTVRATKWVR